MFGVLQLGLGLAAEYALLIRDPGYADKERRLAQLRAVNPDRPLVLMIGTSRAGYGFHAGRIEDQLAGRTTVFNFGIPASGPVTHVVYLRRLLAAGHRPALLFAEVLPPGLADLPGGPLEARFLYGDRLRHDELDTVIGYDFPTDAIRSKWRQSVLVPWHALRFPLLGRVTPSALPWHLRFDWSRTTDPHGWSSPVATEVTPLSYNAGLKQAEGEYRAILHDYRPAGGAARALTDLLTLCQTERIPVRLVLMPESTDFRRFYPPATVERLDRFLRELCAAHGCALIDARGWVPDAAFVDGHHLLRKGAEAFSDRLTREAIGPFLGR